MSAPTELEVSVVIVNWNTAHLIDECLETVRSELESTAHEIIVVDNGSTDGSIEHLAANHADVRVLAQTDNLGYQAACNIGSRAATAPSMLHINTDARLTPGSYKALRDVLDAEPDVGVVAPRLVYGDGSFQRWTAGRLPSLSSVAHSFVFGDRFSGRGMWIDADRPESGRVGWVSSACLMVRREVFDAIGGLDESFFAYMDDVDLCERAGELGWTTWYEPSATAVHFMGGSQDRTVGVSKLAIANLIKWFRVRRGVAHATAVACVMAFGFALRAGVHFLRGDKANARAHFGSVAVALAAIRPPKEAGTS